MQAYRLQDLESSEDDLGISNAYKQRFGQAERNLAAEANMVSLEVEVRLSASLGQETP